MRGVRRDQPEHGNHCCQPAHAAKASSLSSRAVSAVLHMRLAGVIDHAQCKIRCCSGGVRLVLGGRKRAVLMRARRALGAAELAGRDGLVNCPGCRTVTAECQRLLELRGPSMEFAPMREVRFNGKRHS